MHNLVGLPTLTADEGSLAILKPDPAERRSVVRRRRQRIRRRSHAGQKGACHPADAGLQAELRGSNPALFLNPGRAKQSMTMVPDYVVRLDISPRNLNLVR